MSKQITDLLFIISQVSLMVLRTSGTQPCMNKNVFLTISLIILWFSKLVASDQHGLVMLSLGYLIYVPSMCQL